MEGDGSGGGSVSFPPLCANWENVLFEIFRNDF